MSRCVPCWVARRIGLWVGVAREDELAIEDAAVIVRPRARFAAGNMPSRADRNRLRRMAHREGVAWLVVRGEP